jgi:hypothetical protein
MALVAKSSDEITTELVDIYESLLREATGRPLTIYRNNNNKVYLVFKALAEGFRTLLDSVITLRNRFNPALCDEADLYDIAKLVGTDTRKGAGSVLRVTVTNESETRQTPLLQGTYQYSSVMGMAFLFDCTGDITLDPGGQKTLFAVSKDIGSYRVGAVTNMSVRRIDGKPIDASLNFSCADNVNLLGYLDEDAFSFRRRILQDSARQDHIREIELKIRNLPGILECNLVFNQNNHAVTYDGLTLAPMELLIIITGAPTDDIAEIVASSVLYQTHSVSLEQVVYYRNDCYIGGKFPVYYMFHDRIDFSLAITYRYDPLRLQAAQVESAINGILAAFKNVPTYVETVSEDVIYVMLSNLNLVSVKILNIDIVVDGQPVPYLELPKTKLPNLTGVSFTAQDVGDAV